jgi:hypothetical protein
LLFVSLDYLVPQLVAAERQAVMDLLRDLSEVNDDEARRQIQEILAMKQQHLHKLQELAGATAKAAHA